MAKRANAKVIWKWLRMGDVRRNNIFPVLAEFLEKGTLANSMRITKTQFYKTFLSDWKLFWQISEQEEHFDNSSEVTILWFLSIYLSQCYNFLIIANNLTHTLSKKHFCGTLPFYATKSLANYSRPQEYTALAATSKRQIRTPFVYNIQVPRVLLLHFYLSVTFIIS